jgi:hypothetical protein
MRAKRSCAITKKREGDMNSRVISDAAVAVALLLGVGIGAGGAAAGAAIGGGVSALSGAHAR